MATIIPTVRSNDLSITIDSIARDFNSTHPTKDGSVVSIAGLELAGEAQGLDGVLNSSAAYEVQRLEEKQGLSSSGDWGYYAKLLANTRPQWFKVWVRWNAGEDNYDYYLKANAGEVFSHATPYVGIVH